MTRRLTLDDVVRRPLPGMDAPGAPSFSPNGRSLTYLWSADGSLIRSLWLHDLASGERHVLAGPLPETGDEDGLSDTERLHRERRRITELGVTEYAWAAGPAPALLVPMAGRLFVATGNETRSGVRALPSADGAAGARLSPDGRHVAYSAGGELRVAPTDGTAARQLTDDAEPGITNGLAEYVAAEELDRFDGAWWSADSGSIAFARVDERGIRRSDVGDGERHRYPFAGGPNARVELRVADLDGGPPRKVDLPMAVDDYLARVVAHPHGGWLVAVLPRDQQSLCWLRLAADGTARPLCSVHSEPWLNLDDATRVVSDGRVLRATERSGFRHLELRDPQGELERTLTTGDWVVGEVIHVDEERGGVLFTATRDSVLERHLYRVALDTPHPVADPERLTDEPGWHEVEVSRDGSRWLDTWSDLAHPPRVVVRERDGGEANVLHQPSATGSTRLIPPELLELSAADGMTTLHAAFYRPDVQPAAAETAPPPCVVWVYGGPRSQKVVRAWEMTAFPLRQYLAQCGVAVLVVDGRGSANRGLAFEAVLHRRLGEVEIADQAAAVRQLAERGVLDRSRVAITGGSYGGYMTLRCLAREPDLFLTGAAASPVSDWRGYDTAYTERYLGLPATNAGAYDRSGLLANAGAVHGAPLLIHGTRDENVHPRHSERMVDAMRAAGRDVKLLPLAGQRHQTRGASALRRREGHTMAHLLSGLGLPVPDELAVPD